MTVESLVINISANAASAKRSIDRLRDSVTKIKTPTDKVKAGLGGFAKSASNANTMVKKLARSVGRIAVYRVLRTALKELTQSFKDGLKNAYHFSKGINGELAASLDGIATKTTTMKNQMGAAFGGLLQAIQPILLQIISLITQAANAIAMFFGALNGGTYLKAKDTATAWDKATGAANKYKKTILGFDEINKLDDNSGGGGGVDASGMFENASVTPWMQNLADKIKGAVDSINLTIDDVLFDWTDLNAEQIAEKCVVGICGLLGGVVGFAFGGVPGAIYGTLFGVTIGLIIDALVFDHDGVLTNRELASLIIPALAGLLGLGVGAVAGGVGGAIVGIALATSVKMILDRMLKFDANGKLDKSSLYNAILPALLTIIGGLLGLMLGNAPGALLGMAIGATIAFTLMGDKVSFNAKTSMGASELYEKLKPALKYVLAGITGLALGTLTGGLVGVTLGIALSLVLANVDFSAVASGAQSAVNSIQQKAASNAIAQAKASGVYPTNTTASGYKAGTMNDFRNFASGGNPYPGELFIAGERGAELISSNGSGVSVHNRDQIADSVAVGNAALGAKIDALGNKIESAIVRNKPSFYLDSREIRTGQQRLARSMG